MDFKTKYLKYKLKYLNLKYLHGGMFSTPDGTPDGTPLTTPRETLPEVYGKIPLHNQLSEIFENESDIFVRFQEALNILRFNEYEKLNFLQFTIKDINKDMGTTIPKNIMDILESDVFTEAFPNTLVTEVPFQLPEDNNNDGFTKVSSKKNTTKKKTDNKELKQKRKAGMEALKTTFDRESFHLLLMDRDSGELDKKIGHPGDGLYPLHDYQYLEKLSMSDVFQKAFSTDEYLDIFKKFYKISLQSYLNYSNKSITAMIQYKINNDKIEKENKSIYQKIISVLDKITYEVDITDEDNPWELRIYYLKDTPDVIVEPLILFFDERDKENPYKDKLNITNLGIKKNAKNFFEKQELLLPEHISSQTEISDIIEKLIKLVITAFLKSFGDESYCYMILLFYCMSHNFTTEENKIKILCTTHDSYLEDLLLKFCKPLTLLNENIQLTLGLKKEGRYTLNHFNEYFD